MMGSSAEGYIYDQDSVEYAGTQIMIEDMGNYDTFFYEYPGSVNSLTPMWFGGLELRYRNGFNYSVTTSSGDSIFLAHDFYITTNRWEHINGDLSAFNLDSSKINIVIWYYDDYDMPSSVSYNGRQFVKSVEYLEGTTPTTQGSFDYSSCIISVRLNQMLPNNCRQIYGITYKFPSMYMGEMISFTCAPSNSGYVEFGIGDATSFNGYDNFSDSPFFDEEEGLTNSIRNTIATSIQTGWSQAFGSAETFLSHSSLRNAFNGISVMFGALIGDSIIYKGLINQLLWVSLAIGLSVFILNIGSGIVTAYVNKNKKE